MTGKAFRLAAGLAMGAGAASVLAAAKAPGAYPLDGYDRTGIRRLRAYRMIMDGDMPGRLRLPPGARLPTAAIQLRMAGINEAYDIGPDTPRDPVLQAALERIVGRRDPSYRVALLDITDPVAPRYAAIRPDEGYIPGSVGKLLVMTGLFQELHDRFPGDTAGRIALLRQTMITADRFVLPNSHEVPVVRDDWGGVSHRSVRIGDTFSLWEWVDHMISPSSNAAGAMVWKHVMLLDALGAGYPPTADVEARYFAETPKPALTEASIRVLDGPVAAAGLDTARLHIRTFFTATGSRIVPGRSSLATPAQLVRWLLKLEQGKIVDRWSSMEMKRLLYFTRRRYRYAAATILESAAVFFKSGSLYRCRPEPDYRCGQYRGNAENLMHSVAIVESPREGGRPRVYLISMMSNILKNNSATEHAEIAAQIERTMREIHP